MLKSCKYCGRIHDNKVDCGKKPTKIKPRGEIERYRSSGQWQKKVDEIKERDRYLCQFCIRNLIGTRNKINYKNLSVHHAIPMREDITLKDSNSNLITICDIHHELAESGRIARMEVMQVIKEQIPPG